MAFISQKIARIGQSELHDLAFAQWIDAHLESSVRQAIDRGNLYFWIYAQIFTECRRYEETFSAEVDKRLHDANYIAQKKAEYERMYR